MNTQSHRQQCGSTVAYTIEAPIHLVWSLVRRFDKPQAYKLFLSDCTMQKGVGDVGSVREVVIVSGQPDSTCIERLDRLDDELHLMQFSVVGGENRLRNFRSTVVLREVRGGAGNKTEVVESYQVDVPNDSNEEDTCVFADSVIGFNLKSLGRVAERLCKSCKCIARS